MTRDHRDRLASAVTDALGMGVWLVDAAGETLYRNAGLDGLTPGVNSLADLGRLVPGLPLLGYVRAVSAGGPPVEEPAVLLRSGGLARLVQLRLAAGPQEFPGSVLITIEEVSQRIRVERLRALAETTVALSHQINNPLAILSGEIELIHRDSGVAGERITALKAAVNRIADVLTRLRRLAEPLSADYLPSHGVRMLDLGDGESRRESGGLARRQDRRAWAGNTTRQAGGRGADPGQPDLDRTDQPAEPESEAA